MFLCIAGPVDAACLTVMALLREKGYTALAYKRDLVADVMNSRKWKEDAAVVLPSPNRWAEFKKRPFCVFVNVEVLMSSEIARLLAEEERLAEYNQHVLELHALRDSEVFDASNYKELLYSSDCRLLEGEVDRLLSHSTRPKWDEYFMRIAVQIGHRSNCMKRKVGAVIVNRNRIVTTGYNGTSTKSKNCTDGGCSRCNRNTGTGVDLGNCFCLHAEESAFLEAKGTDCEGGSLYVTLSPCRLCARKILQMRIKKVFYLDSYAEDQTVIDLFEEHRVSFIKSSLSGRAS